LDPDEGVGWKEVVEAARLCRTLLNKIELECYVKTTGGKGLHVVVPLQPTVDWTVGKAFAKAVADLIVSAFSDRFTSQMAKARRTGKIFIDYLRNDEGSTAVAAFSTRARAKAPVAMTLAWDDLGKRDLRFDYFSMKNAIANLKKRKVDPWAGLFKTQQSLTTPILARVGVQGQPEETVGKNRWRKRK
jgi:bifunctional non-homologous end joining protein LigD